MGIEIFNMDQGSIEWHAIRAGIPTASCFADLLTKPRSGAGLSKTAITYAYKLAGEIITGNPMPTVETAAMRRGKEWEDKARQTYELITGNEATRIGFIRNGKKGASPDSLVGADGAIEIKTKEAYLAIEVLMCDDFPEEHKAQSQGVLWLAERDWIDLVVYAPGIPTFIKRATRDAVYIRELSNAVDAFNEKLERVVERVRSLGGMAA